MDQYILYVSFVLAVLALVFFFVQNARLNKMIKQYQRFIRGLGDKDVEKLMTTYVDSLNELKHDVYVEMNQRLEKVEKKIPYCIQNAALVNYNAFDNVSNEMSFSAVMMDEWKNGFILTGIYSRDHSYVYAKEIREGKSMRELSREEIEAMNKAQRK